MAIKLKSPLGYLGEARVPAMLERAESTLTCRDLAGATGLEPATSGVTGRRSNQLNYAPAFVARAQRGGPAAGRV